MALVSLAHEQRVLYLKAEESSVLINVHNIFLLTI